MSAGEMAVAPPHRVRAFNIDPDSSNRIHADDVARQFGFAGALVPGVEVMAYLCHPLVEAWGERFLRTGRAEIRLRQPVYDGDEVVAEMHADGADAAQIVLRGPDGEPRATGHASVGAGEPVDLSRFSPAPTPDGAVLPEAGPQTLRPGEPLGSITEPVDAASYQRYLDAISETLPIHRSDCVLQPGALLRMANAVLVRNVTLGPWIHASSAFQLLGVARVPCELRAHAVVTDRYDRSGRSWVRYDVLVLADGRPAMLVDHTAIYAL